MSHYRAGHKSRAREFLEKTRSWLQRASKRAFEAARVKFGAREWLELNLLYREAESLLGSGP